MAPPSPSRINKQPPRGSPSSNDSLYVLGGSSPTSDGGLELHPVRRKGKPSDIRTGGPSSRSMHSRPRPFIRNDSDSNAINRGQGVIDATHARLRDSIEASHRELEIRIARGEGSARNVTVTQHLRQTPPSSPANLAESPKSAREQQRKRSFQKLQFDYLVDTDSRFCNSMKTVAAIREWWAFAKDEWLQKRAELERLEMSIETYERQREELLTERGQLQQLQAQQVFGIPTTHKKLDRYARQTESLGNDRREILKWLADRRGLFKQVWNTFSLLNIGTPLEAAEHWSSSGTSRASSTDFPPPPQPQQGGLRSNRRGVDTRAYKNKPGSELYAITDDDSWDAVRADPSLFESHNWAFHALLEMQEYRRGIQGEHAKVVHDQEMFGQRSEKFKNRILAGAEQSAVVTRQVERQMRTIRAECPQDEASRLLAVIEMRHAGLSDEMRLRRDDQEEFYSNRDREYELGVHALSTAARLKALDVIISLLTYVVDAFDRSSRVEGDTIEYMYKICRVQWTRRGPPGDDEGASKIRIALQDYDLSQSRRTAIVQRLEQHYNWNSTPEDLNEKLVRTLRHKGINSRDPDRPDRPRIYKVLKNFRTERKRFSEAVDDIKSFFNPNIPLRDINPVFQNELPGFSDNLPPLPTLVDLENLLTPDLRSNRFGWGSNILTAGEAKVILEVRPSLKQDRRGDWIQEETCWGELLTQTFTSPDIGQAFYDTSKSWHIHQFANLLNSFLVVPVPEREIQAFLIYTTHIDELFHRGFFTKKISPIPTCGWESMVENGIRGLARKPQMEPKSLSKLIKRVEDVFRGRPDKFFTQGREVEKRELWRVINRYLSERNAISSSDLDALLAHWQLRGKYFIEYPSDSEPAGTVVQVDNGWGYAPQLVFPAIGGYRPKGMRWMHNNIKSTNITELDGYQQRQTVGEGALYAAVFLREGSGGVGGMYTEHGGRMNWEVSRNHFHWYLRNMSERGDYFRLRRNGEVSVLSRHWDNTFIHPAMRPGGANNDSRITLWPGAEGLL